MKQDLCVLCGAVIPEGSHVCPTCRHAILKQCIDCPHIDKDICHKCVHWRNSAYRTPSK